MDFKEAIYRIESDEDRNTMMLEIKRDNEGGWQTCFEFPHHIDFTVHTYLAASGPDRRRRAVNINSIKFYDNEMEIEGEEEQLRSFD